MPDAASAVPARELIYLMLSLWKECEIFLYLFVMMLSAGTPTTKAMQLSLS